MLVIASSDGLKVLYSGYSRVATNPLPRPALMIADSIEMEFLLILVGEKFPEVSVEKHNEYIVLTGDLTRFTSYLEKNTMRIGGEDYYLFR